MKLRSGAEEGCGVGRVRGMGMVGGVIVRGGRGGRSGCTVRGVRGVSGGGRGGAGGAGKGGGVLWVGCWGVCVLFWRCGGLLWM